jgi:hypothetical protein
MDDNRARQLGLIGGGGALLIALGVAAVGGPQKPPEPPPAVVAPSGVAQAAPSAAATAPIPDVEAAMAGAPPVSVTRPAQKAPAADPPPENPNLEFIVRFDDRHPLARAQALYLQGKHGEAVDAARATLAQRPEFAGLCFDRFTLGAELVLAHCVRVPRAQVQRTSDRWVKKLRAMRGVQYADANVIVQPDRK